MAKAKAREHKEWFRKLSTRTCACGAKKTDVYSWGEYVAAKWRTIDYVCQTCWHSIQAKLVSHKSDCGCNFILVGKNCQLPSWLNLDVCAIPPVAELPEISIMPFEHGYIPRVLEPSKTHPSSNGS